MRVSYFLLSEVLRPLEFACPSFPLQLEELLTNILSDMSLCTFLTARELC